MMLAQSAGDDQTLQNLAKQVEELRAKIKDLESRSTKEVASPPAPITAPQAPLETSDAASVQSPSTPIISFRGFGDVGLNRLSEPGNKSSSFGLGQVDFFVTSQLASRFGLLMETVIETDTNNQLSVDLERFLFRYRQNRHFNVDVGRYHSAIGYFNTAYHHGTWFQTAITRPHIFQFEDKGGLLPIHNVGLYFYGEVPSSSLNLHYTLELGNGRDYRAQEVQGVTDNTPGKSVNLAFQIHPSQIPGLELGTSMYRDRVSLNAVSIVQHIYSAYAVYNHDRVEVLTEFIDMRHTQEPLVGMKITTSVPAFYTQWSYRVAGPWRPYFRYEYTSPSAVDPIVQELHAEDHFRASYLGGTRYDFTSFAAAKFELQRILRRNQAAENRVALNVAFTF